MSNPMSAADRQACNGYQNNLTTIIKPIRQYAPIYMSLRLPAFLTLSCILGLSYASAESAPDGITPDRLKEGPDTLNIGEVNVTSIKQARSLLRQPVTVTTLRQSELERFDIAGMKGVSELAPNFFMPDYGSRMTSSIYVRGIGARIDQPAVGLNVDNVPYLNKDAYDFDSPDIQRIEILRGPQSTLFGRNTIAGLINIYTLSPMYYQGMRVLAGATTHGNYRLGLSYYRRFSPKWASSLSAYGNRRNGYFRNSHDGSRADREHSESLRWRTIFRPSDALSIENVASYGHAHQHGYPYASAETGRIDYNDPSFYRRTTFTDGLTVTWTTPSFTLASITGFQYLSDNMTLDQDFLPESYFTLTQKQHDRNVTQDIIIRGTKGNYGWLGGIFGFYKYADISAPVTFKEDGINRLILDNVNSMLPPGMRLGWDQPELLLGSDFRNPTKGIAFYHQSSYDIDNLSFAVGLRFDYEHTALRYHSYADASATMWRGQIPLRTQEIHIDNRDRLSQHFTQFLPKFSVTYNLPHSALFLSVAKGYKSGGFNTQMFSDFLQQRLMEELGRPVEYDVAKMVKYKPEISWNYELGGHFSVDRNRVYSSFALFLIECRDQQLTMFPDETTTGRMMTNAGKTRSFGVELSASYSPSPRWRFNGSYGYTNAKFRDYDDGHNDFSGKYIPYAPQHTMFIGANYIQPLRLSWADRIAFNINCRGVGQIYWNEENTVKQPFYSLIGASVSLEHKNYSLILWGENIADADYDTFYFVSINNAFLQRGKPRQLGITLRLNI